MPIRAEHRQYYRAEFRRYRLQLIEEAGGEICAECGVELAEGINATHSTHDPRQPPDRLRCPSCHARHDSRHCFAIHRRRKAKATGQLWLMPELEWAPFADWEIPGWIYDRLIQLRLFDSAGY